MYLGLQCLDGVPKVIAAHSLLAQVLHMGSDQKIISLFLRPTSAQEDWPFGGL